MEIDPTSRELWNQRIAALDPVTSYDWRTVRLASNLCVYNGYDPDAMVVDIKAARRGPFNSVLASETVPAWTLYIGIARELSASLK